MEDSISEQDWQTAQRVLRAVLVDPALAAERQDFKTLVAGVNRLGRKYARQVAAASEPVQAPEERLSTCYICKERFSRPHPQHPQLCPRCGEHNSAKRHARADLSGRVAVLTGGRIKIGYVTSLKLLRDGARVIVTTRFPQDAAQRYAQEPDFQVWRERLVLYGLDLRDPRGVQAFIERMQAQEPRLDILINNAAQTISRPPQFYAHLLDGERQALPSSAEPLTVWQPAPLPVLEEPTAQALTPYFPAGQLDLDGQQLDLRPDNSWSASLGEVGTRELLEVQLVNAIAPFMLCTGLLPLLRRSPQQRRFIVNVSAMEGQFARRSKTERHPHTNMAKAALNMLTRTSGPGLAREGIFMTSVDTGWVTNENPFPKAQRMADLGFETPLDLTDGAARVYDPIVMGLSSSATPFFGVFLKDYQPYAW